MMNADLKRFLTILLTVLAALLPARAQEGLEISSLFKGSFTSDPNVTETLIAGNQKFLRSHKLSLLATFKAPAAKYGAMVEKLVKADAATAIGKKVRYKDGRLFLGLFMLKPTGSGKTATNRYLYYLNPTSGPKPYVLLVYMEGKLEEQEVADLLENLPKKSK